MWWAKLAAAAAATGAVAAAEQTGRGLLIKNKESKHHIKIVIEVRMNASSRCASTHNVNMKN